MPVATLAADCRRALELHVFWAAFLLGTQGHGGRIPWPVHEHNKSAHLHSRPWRRAHRPGSRNRGLPDSQLRGRCRSKPDGSPPARPASRGDRYNPRRCGHVAGGRGVTVVYKSQVEPPHVLNHAPVLPDGELNTQPPIRESRRWSLSQRAARLLPQATKLKGFHHRRYDDEGCFATRGWPRGDATFPAPILGGSRPPPPNYKCSAGVQ